jgi:phosphotriesterase-related protein
MTIQTVSGPINAQDLGVTLPHEHLLLQTPSSYPYTSKKNADIAEAPITLQNYRRMLRGTFYPKNALILDEEQVATDELAMFRKAGGSTILDMTVDGLGRDPEAIRRISEKSGVNVVMGTGFFIGSSHPARVNTGNVDSLADELINDLTNGVGTTGIKAGVIGEIGISPSEILPNEEKVLHAVAHAHLSTGAAINVHTWGDSPGKRTQGRVLEILEKEGVRMGKVALSHMEQVKVSGRFPTTDWDYVNELAERGPYVCLDAFGQDWPWGADWSLETGNPVYMPSPTDFDRARGVIFLMEKGKERNVLLSHDVWHKLRLKKYGGDGYDHLLVNVPQIFKSLGVDEASYNGLMVDNPRRYLA